MARKISRRETVLLGVLAAAVVGYFWYDSRPSSTLRGIAARDETPDKKKKEEAAKAPAVRMDLLARSAESYDAEGRDLFQYSQRPPSGVEVRKLRAEAERRRKEYEEAQKRAAIEAERRRKEDEERAKLVALNPPPPPPPQPPAITMRYLGFIGPKDDRIVVLEDGKDMILARKGEVVKDQFRVVDVKWESVVMGFVKPEFKGQTRELTMAHK